MGLTRDLSGDKQLSTGRSRGLDVVGIYLDAPRNWEPVNHPSHPLLTNRILLPLLSKHFIT